MRRGMWLGIVVGVMALSLMAGGIARAETVRQKLTKASTIESVIKRGALRVGFSTFLPWAMKDKTGKFIGFEIDVAQRLAKDLGVKCVLTPTKWSGIIPALLTGKFDVIIGGMSITPQRSLKVNFSIPYDFTGMSLVAHKKLAAGKKTLAEFNQPGVIIAVRLGTTAATAAKKYLPKATIKQFDDESQALQELLNGRATAVVSSAPLPAFHAWKYPDKLFLPLEDDFTQEPIGFAVRKGDPDTLNTFNSWIRLMTAQGWLAERKNYWFRTKAWEDQVK